MKSRRVNTEYLHNPIIAQSTECSEEVVFDAINEELSKSRLCNYSYIMYEEVNLSVIRVLIYLTLRLKSSFQV